MGLKMTCPIMDDVLVSGKTDEDHHQNIVNLFDRFRGYGLRVKPSKCSFMQMTVTYMGREMSAERHGTNGGAGEGNLRSTRTAECAAATIMAGYGEFPGPVRGQPGNVGTSVTPTAGANEANVPMDKRV